MHKVVLYSAKILCKEYAFIADLQLMNLKLVHIPPRFLQSEVTVVEIPLHDFHRWKVNQHQSCGNGFSYSTMVFYFD